MKVHVLQHVAFEGPGSISRWAEIYGHSLTYTRFDKPNWGLPNVMQFDLLVVMGGPMGAHDDAKYPWMVEEKKLIRQAVDAGRKVLGICLGAQLAASVLGAKVAAHTHKEIGWFEVAKVSRNALLAEMPERMRVFHWHGDTFGLPYGAEHLLASEACDHQGFIWRNQVLGLQCHLEVGPEEIEGLLAHGAHEIAGGGEFVQSAEQIRAHSALAGPMLLVMERLLERFTRL